MAPLEKSDSLGSRDATQALVGLFEGTRVKTNMVEFRTECYVGSKVETGEDSNLVIVMDAKRPKA